MKLGFVLVFLGNLLLDIHKYMYLDYMSVSHYMLVLELDIRMSMLMKAIAFHLSILLVVFACCLDIYIHSYYLQFVEVRMLVLICIHIGM